MSAYIVGHDYASHPHNADAPVGFRKGDEVEVDDDFAAWVNTDSPGTLKPKAAKKATAQK